MVNEPADSVARNGSRYPLRATLGVAHRPRPGSRAGHGRGAGPNHVVPRSSPPRRYEVPRRLAERGVREHSPGMSAHSKRQANRTATALPANADPASHR